MMPDQPAAPPSASQVKERALALGFIACGITDLRPNAHADALDAWLAHGYAGVMRYLHRQAKKRKDPTRITAGAARVIVVLENYFSPETDAERTAPRIAKYARGMDYHVVTLARLRVLAEWLIERGAGVAHAWCDDGPVPERELAQRAGLGWIGKNGMLIRPGFGSWAFIGTIFTDLELPADAPFATDHCGTCTRCLDACPTSAFVSERVVDATKCISYLTIEQKDPIPPALVPRLEGWAFGCDICNDVCPWNERFATPSTVAELAPKAGLRQAVIAELGAMDDDGFRRRFGETPLARAGLERLRRNVAAAQASEGGAARVVPGV